MKCPFCSTENREDRETCYHCGKDVSMLRLIVNKARYHYNLALEHAERQRFGEALVELQNSLELDHSFVPAHVVMGTVYAKLERYEEAEKAWHEALALDPHVLKAHDYIAKAETVQAATPILRRLRWAVGAMAVLALAFFALSVWRLWPSPEAADLRAINAMVAQGNFASALAGAQRLQNAAKRPAVRQAAALLERAVETHYETAVLAMMSHLFENHPVAAHKVYASVARGRQVPEPYARQLSELDKQAVGRALAAGREWLDDLEQNRLTYEEVRGRIADLRGTFDDPTVKAALADYETSAAGQFIRRTLAEAPASAGSTTETLAWLGRLRELPTTGTGLQDEVASASGQLFTSEIARIEAQLAAAKADPAAIDAVVADLARLAPYGPPESARALAEAARTGLAQARVDQFLAALSKAGIEDIPEVEQQIASFDAADATSATKQQLDAAAAQAQRRLAEAMLEWFRARESRFELRRLSEEDAAFAVERADFTLQHVPGKGWRYRRDNVTFFTAAALMQLGRSEEAAQWFDRLETQYPQSSYVKIARPMIEALRKKVRE